MKCIKRALSTLFVIILLASSGCGILSGNATSQIDVLDLSDVALASGTATDDGAAQTSAPQQEIVPLTDEKQIYEALYGEPYEPYTKYTSEDIQSLRRRAIYNADKPMVALTFDDGPGGESTKSILATLTQYNVKATFFMLGKQAKQYPDIVNSVIDAGCEIGNHSYYHSDFLKMTQREIADELAMTSELMLQEHNYYVKLVRTPYGRKSDEIKAAIKYPIIFWNIDTMDWNTRNAQSTIEAVLDKAKDGDIILMHDLYMPTAEAVAQIVPGLIERGFQLLTVSEMFEAKGVQPLMGTIYRKIKS